MGKPRMIILIRHAQSEGNKKREIHQTTPDHRVKLTPEGWTQALAAGRKLRSLLRPTDTLHFFTSPYRRTRETTEGILQTLTSADNATPSPTATTTPSPFPRHTIKVYEEPRLREQDFGNFQPSASTMSTMWRERAEYGHFFYRIPNGESAADAYDRVSGFNESLWRSFSEDDFASVAVLVTHGLMTRVFLMKWYHFSVEYFEDLRNVDHCEFVVMTLHPETGKYVLQNQLRTWSELKRERERERRQTEAAVGVSLATTPTSPDIPVRKKWEGCRDEEGGEEGWRRRQRRQNTADLFMDDQFEERVHEALKRGEEPSASPNGVGIAEQTVPEVAKPPVFKPLMFGGNGLQHDMRGTGRDFGGSRSGNASPGNIEGGGGPVTDTGSEGLKGDAGLDGTKGGEGGLTQLPKARSSMSLALHGDLRKKSAPDNRVRADALGDQSEDDEERMEERDARDSIEKMQAAERNVDASVR